MKLGFDVRIRRMVAFWIDWFAFVLLVMVIFLPLSLISKDSYGSSETPPIVLLVIYIVLIIAGPVTFMLRDFIFKGRSVGKRALGLVVCDRYTNALATPIQRVLRNLLLMIWPIDGIILLITGSSIGDRIAKTIVLPKEYVQNSNFTNNQFLKSGEIGMNNNYNNSGMPNQNGNGYNNGMTNQNAYGNNAMPNQYGNAYNNGNAYNGSPNQYGNAYGNNPAPNQYGNPYNGMPNQYNAGSNQWQSPKKNKKLILIIVLVIAIPILLIIGFVAVIFGVVFGTLNAVKDTEEYETAYSYVVNSDTFEKLDVDEEDITLTGYKSSAKYSIGGDEHSNATEFTFDVDGVTFEVICHEGNQEWYVCEDCTYFN